MKKNKQLEKFQKLEVKALENIKGGRSNEYIFPGGNGGSGFIDWGEIDIRVNSVNILGKKGRS